MRKHYGRGHGVGYTETELEALANVLNLVSEWALPDLNKYLKRKYLKIPTKFFGLFKLNNLDLRSRQGFFEVSATPTFLPIEHDRDRYRFGGKMYPLKGLLTIDKERTGKRSKINSSKKSKSNILLRMRDIKSLLIPLIFNL